MNERIITDSHIRSFEQQLMLEEKSACTVRKYLHDVRMFADFCAGAPVMQDVLIAYKEQLCEKYSVRSINSMLASLGSLFSHLARAACKGHSSSAAAVLRRGIGADAGGVLSPVSCCGAQERKTRTDTADNRKHGNARQ